MYKNFRTHITTALSLLLLAPMFGQGIPIIEKGAQLQLRADGFSFTEGPATAANGDVYFTDQPNDRILKWDAKKDTVSVWLQPSGRSNGLFFDQKGSLIACADEKNELWRIGPDKNVTVLVTDVRGKRLGGPNDVWVHPNGSIYFTDPFYKRPWWQHDTPDIKERRVYYRTKRGKIKIAAENFERPNGIIGNAEGTILYISDIGPNRPFGIPLPPMAV